MNRERYRTARRAVSRDTSRETPVSQPVSQSAPRAHRRSFGLNGTHRTVTLVEAISVGGKHLVRPIASTRAVKRISGGRTR